MSDILSRLENPDQALDAVDDAIKEIRALHRQIEYVRIAAEDWKSDALQSHIDRRAALALLVDIAELLDDPDPLESHWATIRDRIKAILDAQKSRA